MSEPHKFSNSSARTTGPVLRAAQWIVDHPRRLLSLPLIIGLAAMLGAAIDPSSAMTAATIVLGCAGVEGVIWSLIWLAQTYIGLRTHVAVALLVLVWHGTLAATILLFSLVFIYAALTFRP